MAFRAGVRFYSQVDSTELIAVHGSDDAPVPDCGGLPMSLEPVTAPQTANSGVAGAGAQIGKRYGDEETGIELLCVKSGAEPITLNGRALKALAAKVLPASD